ncbi:MAG: radical SAM family heme chaperone HemW [Butyrivibrio sp.]|nr:radical SAM family heme chaperone HemW [Butyrivibrio sp.]
MKDNLSVYVHIPFCKRKCLYCDFLSYCPGEGEVNRYFDALEKEIRLSCKSFSDYSVKTIFFGGGTPSFPDERYVCRILDVLRSCFEVDEEAEISIEVNPASAIREKLKAYREAGFNRISIGVQSFNDKELKAIGRLHDSEAAVTTFYEARDIGFKNINIDLMSALPGQSADSYLSTLKRAAELKPEHISAYSLIIEEGTPFYDMKLNLPDEEDDRLMYHETGRFLAAHGYNRYEISNYALPGFECRHNKVYWQRGNYVGFGPGAASMTENIRRSNTGDVNRYLEELSAISVSSISELKEEASPDIGLPVWENTEHLNTASQMEEFMFLGLRLTEGISTAEFERQFGKSVFEVYGPVIKKYESMGLLYQYVKSTTSGKERYLSLTERGLDVSNTVMADFLF